MRAIAKGPIGVPATERSSLRVLRLEPGAVADANVTKDKDGSKALVETVLGCVACVASLQCAMQTL